MSKKNKLDEFQEQKLLKIESRGFWIMYWALLSTMIVQRVMRMGTKDFFHYIGAEWIVFMCISIYMVGCCLKNGIWERKFEPSIKTNAIISLVSSTISGIIFFITIYFKFNSLSNSIKVGILIFIIVFVATFGILSILAIIYKKRVENLEYKCEKNSDV